MATLVYIDETGSVGRAANQQRYLTLVAAMVDETQVQALRSGFRRIAMEYLHHPEVEFHGTDVWHGKGPWEGLAPPDLLSVLEAVVGLLDECEVDLADSTIDKHALHARYGGAVDDNAYLLALQFLLEKIDAFSSALKVVVADDSKEQELRAIKMVADLQVWSSGEVPGRRLQTVID